MKYLKVIRKKEREKKEKGKSFYVYFLDDYYKYRTRIKSSKFIINYFVRHIIFIPFISAISSAA
jgi:hypothetical protein